MRPITLFAAVATVLAVPAAAALAPGVKAPTFTAEGAVAGKPYTVDLRAALKKGPVVLYFFPSAFTGGCNAEAHAFAEAIDDFKAAGATVIGMTALIGKYDVSLKKADGTATGLSTRTSFVIAPNGKILFAHNDMNPADHIRLTLAAVRDYRAKHKH